MNSWRQRAASLKRDTYALYLALRHPRVPWYAKALIALLVFYAFSPIDLIPDFIPVLGYLDDILIIAAGFSLAIKMIPPEVMLECREKARAEEKSGRPVYRSAAVVIVVIWLALLLLVLKLALGLFS
jgi:uncharacterized membrane protein YkvA (DUF1232 family)